MFYSKAKKEALQVHERAVERYNKTYAQMQGEGESLYRARQKSLDLVQEIEELIDMLGKNNMPAMNENESLKEYLSRLCVKQAV